MFAFNVVNEFVNDDDWIVTYDEEERHEWEKQQFKEDGLAEGRKFGIAEGRKSGIEQGKKEMIQNMYKNHIEIPEISKIANIPEAKVRELLS